MTTKLNALIIICTLSPSPNASSSESLARDIQDQLIKHNVETSLLRAVDHAIMPGVEVDMGKGDDWPMIRKQIIASDIVIIATPTWLGHMSSISQRVLERLDAEISIEDDEGRPGMYGKVAGVAIVGNEDGAHKVSADLFQALNDIGFTVPAGAKTYWNDEAMGSREYKDLAEVPETVQSTTATLASNLVHLAMLLKENNYPAQ